MNSAGACKGSLDHRVVAANRDLGTTQRETGICARYNDLELDDLADSLRWRLELKPPNMKALTQGR